MKLSFVFLLTAICLTACLPPHIDFGKSQAWEIDGVRVTASSPKAYYQLNEMVTVEFRIENIP